MSDTLSAISAALAERGIRLFPLAVAFSFDLPNPIEAPHLIDSALKGLHAVSNGTVGASNTFLVGSCERRSTRNTDRFVMCRLFFGGSGRC